MAIDQEAADRAYRAQQDAFDAAYAASQRPPAPAAPPPAPEKRGAFTEIGTALARGALVGLPDVAGQALRFAGAEGTGQQLRGFAKRMEARPDLTLRPEDQNAVTNFFAQGAEQIAPALAPVAAVAGLVAAAPVSVPAAVTIGGGALGGGALFGLAAGQETLDKAKAAGIDPKVAQEAANLNALQTTATQTALGVIGGNLFSRGATAASKLVGRQAPALADDVLGQMAGTSGVLKPFLKELPLSTAEAVATGAAQTGLTAQIEKSYGIDDTDALTAMKDSIVPMLSLSAAMAPLGLAGRAMGARSAQKRTQVLGDANTAPELRTELANQYADVLAKSHPAGAAEFRKNAELAIKEGQPLDVNASLFQPGAVQSLAEQPTETLGLPFISRPATMVVFPDGSVGTHADAERYIADLPENERVAARARLLGTGERQVAPPPAPDPAAVVALHEQVKAALVAAGEKPAEPMTRAQFGAEQGLKGQQLSKAYKQYLADPATQESIMRADADRLEAIDTARAAEPAPELNRLVDEAAPPQSEPTTMAVALQEATRRAQEDRAFAAREAQVARERDAIANITRGEEQARAALEGEVRPDPNAPKLGVELERDLAAAAETEGVAWRKQDVALVNKALEKAGVTKAKTYDDQIAALQKAVDAQKKQTVTGDRLRMVLDRWVAERPVAPEPAAAPEAPTTAGRMSAAPSPQVEAIAAAAGENLPQPAPGLSEPPSPATIAAVAELPDMTASPHQQMADRFGSIVASYDAREAQRGLTAVERAQRNKAAQHQQELLALREEGDVLNDAAITVLNAEAAKLSAPLSRRLEGDSTGVARPELIAPTGKLVDTLGNIQRAGAEDWSRKLAAELTPLVGDVDIVRAGRHPVAMGEYNRVTRKLSVFEGAESEHTLLHEAVHAATMNGLDRAETMLFPSNQAEARMRKAYKEMDAVRKEAMRGADAKKQYGLMDVHEFVAELDSNPDFRQYLKEQGDNKSLWKRTVEAIRNLLGLGVDSRAALERAIDARNELYGALRAQREFDRSPAGAVAATERTVANLVKMADSDTFAERLSMKRLPRAMYEAMMGWKTLDFIAGGLDAWPEMRRAGVAQAVNAYRAARDAKRVISERITDSLGRYTTHGEHVLRKTKDPRGVNYDMAYIAGEATIRGVDYRKNFADNLKAGRKLDAADKAAVDDIHRRFTQLQRAHPELAKSLVEGEQQGRKMLIEKTANLARMLLEAHSGVTQRLEAELARMAPTDAARARLEVQLQQSRREGALAATHARGLDIGDKALGKAQNTDAYRFLDGASAALDSRLAAMFKAVSEMPEGSALRSEMGEVARAYYSQVRDPYFSLGRDGDYFVKVKFQNMDAAAQRRIQEAARAAGKVIGSLTGPDAKDYAFFRVETLEQAAALRRRIEQAGGASVDRSQTAAGRLADRDMANAAGITPALRQLRGRLDDMVDSDPRFQGPAGREAAAAMKQAIERQLLSMLPETSVRSAKMRREGVPGYDADFYGNFARRAAGHAMDTANLYTSRAFGDALRQLDESVGVLNRGADLETADRAQVVANEVRKRYANSMKPVENEAISLINSFGHSFYLAMSPAHIIRTFSQPFQRVVPFIGGRYGHVRAATEMAKATGTALRIVQNTIAQGWSEGGLRGVANTGVNFDGMNLSAPDRAFLEEMRDRGVFKLGQAQRLQHAITGGSQLQRDVAALAAMTTQYAEMANRVSAGLAAFRLASKDGRMSREAAMDWAVKAINNGMDNFDPDNTARLIGRNGFAGQVTPLLTQFMNYQLQFTQQLVRTVHDGYFGRDNTPEGQARAKAARKEFGGLMATSAMISGLLGLPFANALAGAYNWLTEDENDPRDVRTDIRHYLDSTLGTGVGSLMARGLGEAVNLDTSTFGAQDLLPGSNFLVDRRKFEDVMADQSQALMGPALNAGLDVLTGMNKIAEGNVIKGVEQMLPSGLKPYYKAAQMAGLIGPGGYTDPKGNPAPMAPPTDWEIALQGLGFRSATKARRDEEVYAANTNDMLLNKRKAKLNDQLYKAVTQGLSPAEAIAAIVEFNTANPMQPITDPAAAVRRRIMENAIGMATGLGTALTRRQAAVRLQESGFAGGEE